MITSLIEMLQLPKFGHMTTSATHLFGDVIGRNYNVITFILKTFIIRRPRVVNFADIIKITTMFIKATFRDPKKVKKTYVLKCNLYPYFLI